MKGKHLIFFLLFLTLSCKVKEENIIGWYFDKKSFSKLSLNKDHTFQYYTFNRVKFLEKYDLDSCHFVTRGTWKLYKNDLTLNSFPKSYADTERIRNITIKPTASKKSNFLIKGVYGEAIEFGRVTNYIYGSTKMERHDIDDAFFSKVNMKVAQNDLLFFDLIYYKPLHLSIRDSVNADYIITLEPYYRKAYFNNKKVTVKRNRVLDNNLRFKKDKPVKNGATL